MPTENEKTENLVDVGEADQQETEVNLDDKGEPEKVETVKEEMRTIRRRLKHHNNRTP